MVRQAFKISANPRPEKALTTTMPIKGINLEDLPQLQDINFAQAVENYLIHGKGRLVKRKGYTVLFDPSIATVPTMLVKWTDDLYVYAYGTTCAIYRLSTASATIVKSNFVSSNPFSGVAYKGYFFICNGGEPIGRISQTLAYDNQTVNFAVGRVITGGTSGATATILEDSDSGTTGTLTLGNIIGTFLNNELITASGGGSADVNGTLTFTFTSVSASPNAKVLALGAKRLLGGNTQYDNTEIRYSSIDDGTNPPFADWTEGTDADQAGFVSNGNLGQLNSINILGGPLGEQIIGYCEDGIKGFSLDTVGDNSLLKKVENVRFIIEGFGGTFRSLATPKGIFYANERGIWRMSATVANQPDNQRISKQLGDDYFDDVDLTNVDFVFEPTSNLLLCTIAKDSEVNNTVLGYYIDLDAWIVLKGWNINRFMIDGATIYGLDTNAVKIYTLFDGEQDGTAPIATKYQQELNVGDLKTIKSLENFFIQGNLSPNTIITISFDIYDRQGNYVNNKAQALFTAGSSTISGVGYGNGAFGSSGFGGVNTAINLIYFFAQRKIRINEFSRLIVRLTANDKLQHEINFISAITAEKFNFRQNNLTII